MIDSQEETLFLGLELEEREESVDILTVEAWLMAFHRRKTVSQRID